MMEGKKEHLLNIAEMAEILGVSEKTVRQLIKKKTIPYYQIGRRIALDGAEVMAILRREPKSKKI